MWFNSSKNNFDDVSEVTLKGVSSSAFLPKALDLDEYCGRGLINYIKRCLQLIEKQSESASDEIFFYLRKAILSDHILTQHAKRLWLIYVGVRQHYLKFSPSDSAALGAALNDIKWHYEVFFRQGYFEWKFGSKAEDLPRNIIELTASQIKIVEYGKPRITKRIKSILSQKETYDVTYQSFEHMSSYHSSAYFQHILRIS